MGQLREFILLLKLFIKHLTWFNNKFQEKARYKSILALS